jgi:hypothetical protein
MLIIFFMVVINLKVIVNGATFNNSGQIIHSENSNNISNSDVSASFNHSLARPRNMGQALNGFNDNLTADATTNNRKLPRHLVIYCDLIVDHVRRVRAWSTYPHGRRPWPYFCPRWL